jgi:hypothetical protein
MKHLICLSTLFLALACASAHHQRVPLPAQDVEVSSPHVARIYVIDTPELAPELSHARIEQDGSAVGEIDCGSFVCWEREPGPCLISIVFDPTEPKGPETVDRVDIDLEAGETYYYGLSFDRVWGVPKVRMLEHDEARALLAHAVPAQRD